MRSVFNRIKRILKSKSLNQIIGIIELGKDVKILEKKASFGKADFIYNCDFLEDSPLEKLNTITYENIVKNCTSYYIVELINGGFVKSKGRNLVVYRDSIIDELSFDGYYEPDKTAMVGKVELASKKRLGTVLCLGTTGAEDNYFTFSTKLIQRVGFTLSLGYNLDDFDHFLINSYSRGFQKELLELHGIPLSKVIEIENSVLYQADKMVVPSIGLQNVFGNNYIRDVVLSATPQNFKKEKRRVYLSRSDSKWMRLKNEEAITPILNKYNIEKISFNNLTVLEQASIMQSSELFISLHGAGMANIIYCEPGTSIIELMNKNRINVVYHPYSIYQKLNYSYLLLNSLENNDVPQNGEAYKDIVMDDLESFEKMIVNQLKLL